MSRHEKNASRKEPLVKHALAKRLRLDIVTGRLPPGTRIVEGTLGKKFGVAQGSVREAINILAQEGFVAKDSGRSARVVSLSEQDVLHLYELRGAMEGLAARLAAASHADTGKLEQAVQGMREAVHDRRSDELLDADSRFHLELCELSGNPYLQQQARRVLLPFFAFVRMRVLASGQNLSAWERDLDAHQRVLDLIREGEGEVAEQYVRRMMARFAATAYQNWEKKTLPQKKRRSAAEE
jgi:DNA-binding GntR family transcriptional regulator